MVIKLALAGDTKLACAACDGFEMCRSITPLRAQLGATGRGPFREYATAGQGDTAERATPKIMRNQPYTAERRIHSPGFEGFGGQCLVGSSGQDEKTDACNMNTMGRELGTSITPYRRVRGDACMAGRSWNKPMDGQDGLCPALILKLFLA